MTTKPPSPFVLENVRGTAAKISLNTLHKNPALTIFTLPIEGVELVEQQLDAFLGKYTFRSWFQQKSDGSWHPMNWWHTLKGEWYVYDEEFSTDKLTLGLRGDNLVVFTTQEAESDDDEDIPAAKITAIKYRARAGGITEMCFHLQIRPGLGKVNLDLQENQHGPVLITLGETVIAKKAGKQQPLPLEPPKGAAPVVLDGSHIAAATQLRPDQYADGSPKVPDETGHESPPPFESQGGEAIDAELAARHPEAAAEVMGAEANPDTTNTDDPAADLAKFEADAAERLKEFTNVSTTGAIDGRSERVKHQDRKRRGMNS
jgi:hypothetical protein